MGEIETVTRVANPDLNLAIQSIQDSRIMHREQAKFRLQTKFTFENRYDLRRNAR